MNWERFYELKEIDDSGESANAASGFRELLPCAEAPDDRAAVLLAMAVSLRKLGQQIEARDAVSEAGRLVSSRSENHAWVIFAQACLDLDDGNWAGALNNLDRLASNELLDLPQHQDMRCEVERKRGIAVYELGRAADALPLLERALPTGIERATVFYYLGRCYYDLGNLEKAKDCLREALSLDVHPVYQPSAHYVLGLACHWTGQDARAVQEFEWCLEHDNKQLLQRWEVLTAVINSLKALGQEGEVQRYSKMLKEAPS